MKIVIIGAGNVGYHLATALHESQHEIVQIFSRSAARFSDLKHKKLEVFYFIFISSLLLYIAYIWSI